MSSEHPKVVFCRLDTAEVRPFIDSGRHTFEMKDPGDFQHGVISRVDKLRTVIDLKRIDPNHDDLSKPLAGVTVIFYNKTGKLQESKIMGFYRNAEVCSTYQELKSVGKDPVRRYLFRALKNDVVLFEEKDQSVFGGFRAANVKYLRKSAKKALDLKSPEHLWLQKAIDFVKERGAFANPPKASNQPTPEVVEAKAEEAKKPEDAKKTEDVKKPAVKK